MIENNIFFRPFRTTGGAVPFDRITTADYEPAILEGIKAKLDPNGIMNPGTMGFAGCW